MSSDPLRTHDVEAGRRSAYLIAETKRLVQRGHDSLGANAKRREEVKRRVKSICADLGVVTAATRQQSPDEARQLIAALTEQNRLLVKIVLELLAEKASAAAGAWDCERADRQGETPAEPGVHA